MSDEEQPSVADDAVSNRSDDTAIDEGVAAHANGQEQLSDEHPAPPLAGEQGEAPADEAGVADTAGAAHSGPLDINTASASDLDSLPGIGQSFADRIIEYRSTNGPFTSVEDLQKVKGIGAALFAKIAPLVSVGP